MVTCKKCGSELPDSYRYCIYCANKLPVTEKNKEPKRSNPPSFFNICIAVAAVAVFAAVIIAAVVLF